MQPNQPIQTDSEVTAEASLNKSPNSAAAEFVSLSSNAKSQVKTPVASLRSKPFVKKLALTLAALTVLGLLGVSLYFIRSSSSSQQAKNVDNYPVSSLGLEKASTNLTVPSGATELTVNGDVSIAGILSLSDEAIADLGSTLTNKVTIQDTFPGTPQAGNANISGTFGAGSFVGSGSGLTGLNAANINSGTLASGRLSPEVSLLGQTIEASEIQPNIISSINGIVNDGGNIDIVAGTNISVSSAGNTITIASLTGSSGITEIVVGSGLTGGGTSSVVNIGIDSSVVTLQGNTFNGAGQLVQLNGLGQLPALNASLLTNLNASALISGTVSDARLSANVALKNATNIFTPSANSTGVMRIQNSIASVDVLRVDSANTRVGIGFDTSIAPGYTLDVNGDINLASGSAYRIGGVAICTSGGCAPSAGSSDYIQNSASIQTNANIAIQSASTTDDTVLIQGVVGQTADLLRAEDSGGNPIFSVNSSGATNINGILSIISGSTGALNVAKDGISPKTIRVDTVNNRVGIGLSVLIPSYTLDIAGDMNISAGSAYRIGGTPICTASGCMISGGASDFIHNSTATQVANFNIQSASASDVVAVIRGAAGQTADIFQIKDSSNTELVTASSIGELTISPSANSSTAFRIQDASSNTVLQVDTTNGRVNVGGSSLVANLGVAASGTDVGQIINNTGTGASLQIKKSNTDVFTVSDAGQVVIQPSTNTASALTVKNASGGNVLQVASGNSATDSTPSMTFNGSLTGSLANWTTLANSGTSRGNSGSVILNGYIYSTGGSTGSDSNVVQYASVYGDGTTGTWANTTALPLASSVAGAVTYNGRIYVAQYARSSIYYARPNNNGTISSWTTSSVSLPDSDIHPTGAMVVANGYLYIATGGGVSHNLIYGAKINADGSLGSFTTAATLPGSVTRNYAKMVAIDGYLVVMGGFDGSSVDQASVYTFAINPDGTLASGTTTTSLPAARHGGSAFVLNGYIYYAGGYNSSAMYYARLNSDGTISSWSTSSPNLSATVYSTPAVVSNGYVYFVFGIKGGSMTGSVITMTGPRMKLGGTLDLIGMSNSSLSTGAGDSGGSVYAANVTAAGQLSVSGNSNLAGGASVQNLLQVQGDASFKAASASSTSTFQVQDSSGAVLFNVDSANRAVSIGTASGTAALTVQSAANNNLFMVVDDTGPASVMTIADGGATTFRNQTNSTTAFQVQNTSSVSLFSVDTTNATILIGNSTTAVDIKFAGTGTTRNAITRYFTCTSAEQPNDIVAFNGANTVARTTTADSNRVAGVVVAKPGATTCTTAIAGVVAVWFSSNSSPVTVGDPITTSAILGAAQSTTTPSVGAMLGNSLSSKDGSNLVWVRLR